MLALGILACCQAAPPPSDGGAEPNIHVLLDAAVRADLEPLKRALATESGRREICRTVDGISVVHMLLGGLHTAVAGEISRLVGWSGENKHRTLYRHELIEGISAQIQPVLADILRLSPQLVHAALVRVRVGVGLGLGQGQCYGLAAAGALRRHDAPHAPPACNHIVPRL